MLPLMVDNSRKSVSPDFHRASRKAEEAALRRYAAVHWLECVAGPLSIPSEPSETEFISCLRNGIILCNLINKIKPGTIPKVVDNHVPVETKSVIWDSRPLPAYQYFENVRNFLVAVEKLKLPAFEASDLERENIEPGSAARIADCILALKSYHEWKEWSVGNEVYKQATIKSRLVMHLAAKNISRPLNKDAVQPCRQMDMSAVDIRKSLTESIVKVLSQHMVDSKENMNNNSIKGNQDSVQLFSEILSRSLEEKLRKKFPMLNLQETSGKTSASRPQPTFILQENSSMKTDSKHLKPQSRKGRSDLWHILQSQETDLSKIRGLWSQTKSEFEDLQNQLISDLNNLGCLVEEMSNPARGYRKVIQENRKLYNMVQDLKGNIRVHCRIRPMFNAEVKNVVSFCGEDGTIAVLDPSKIQNEARKVYQFNSVYGPMATQGELYKDTQQLIQSALDGHNVCILAYGQTGSGKTYTMYGPSCVSEKEMGINFFALKDLFKTVHKRKNVINYALHLEMVEICNEQIRDLLAEVSAYHDEPRVLNVTSHAVKSYAEAINYVNQGKEKRNSKERKGLNNCSHSVVTIHVQGKDLSGNIFRSHLYLIDFAGQGDEDKSYSCLEDVITSLSQKHSCIYRKDTKLTSLLQDALGGQAKILVFAHVIAEEDSFTDTVNTLNFAQRISTIELGAAQTNKRNSEVVELKNEIEILKSALGDKTASSPQPTKQLISHCDKPRVVPLRTPVKSRRLSMENQGKMPKSPLGRQKTPTKQLISPCDKPRVVPLRTPVKSRRLSTENQGKMPISPLGRQKTPVKSRRLSIENQGKAPKSPVGRQKTPVKTRWLSIENQAKVPKSPVGRQKITTGVTLQPSLRNSVENPSASKTDIIRNPGTGKHVEGSFPRSQRLSIENPMIVRSEKTHKTKETRKVTPPRTCRLSIENSCSVKPDIDSKKGSKATETSCHVRRLSLEGPKDITKEILDPADVNSYVSVMDVPKTPPPSYPNGPTFTDCALTFSTLQPPKTPESYNHIQQHVIHTAVNILTDFETPGPAKSTKGEGSQIKNSLRTIGKLIKGSEKRKKHKLESTSTKVKEAENRAKSPPASKAGVLRRQSPTNLPPPGTTRRTSLGGPNDCKNATRSTTPSVRSSTNTVNRWM